VTFDHAEPIIFRNMKQHEAVIATLEKLGGVATLGQLNTEVFKISDCTWATRTPFASIRRIVQLNKNIYKIKPGLYGLVRMKSLNESKGILQETSKNKGSKENAEFTHSYYQGLLLHLGQLKKLETFVPRQDKNKRFIDQPLEELSTIHIVPSYSYPHIVQRSSTIDVIWFNERQMPHSFFEVEHSTDIQNSLAKFCDLQDFSARMFIVADTARTQEFDKKIKYTSFKGIGNRVQFLNYESLIRQYEHHIQQMQFDVLV
jgi:hypothetical protein